MIPTLNIRWAGFVLLPLILALLVSCGGGGDEPAIPEWAADAVPAPTHLLIREPFFADELAPLDELLAVDVDPFVYGPEAMEPGQYFRYTLSVFKCCVVVFPVDGPAVWSVQPDGIARIDAETGFLVVDEAAAHGSQMTITAVVEGVESPLTADVAIFSSDQNPLLGRWQEDGVGGVRELYFQSDGLYAATWLLLESYMDLFGDYTVDAGAGKIEMIKDWEREPTLGFQGQGDFEIDDQGRLLLTGICSTEPDPENPDCVRRFVRSN
jgi:hypothetical protein